MNYTEYRSAWKSEAMVRETNDWKTFQRRLGSMIGYIRKKGTGKGDARVHFRASTERQASSISIGRDRLSIGQILRYKLSVTGKDNTPYTYPSFPTRAGALIQIPDRRNGQDEESSPQSPKFLIGLDLFLTKEEYRLFFLREAFPEKNLARVEPSLSWSRRNYSLFPGYLRFLSQYINL